MNDCAFTSDGRLLLSASSDTTILVWDLASKARSAPHRLAPKVLDALWRDLGEPDGSRADDAIWTLVGVPQQAVPYLLEKVTPAPPLDRDRIAELFRDLDSDRFATRDRAGRELQALGDMAAPFLRKALAGNVPP